jgi:glycine cleavage system H protein
MNVPGNLLYTREHEWLRLNDDSTALVGITDYAQNSLGDITFAELPKSGRTFKSGATFGVVESVKAASDLFMPIDAEVLSANDTLTATPDVLNRDPYETGWMLKIKVLDRAQLDTLLSPAAYEKLIGS